MRKKNIFICGRFNFILIFLFALLSGCITLRDTMLPASNEKKYDFDSYVLLPPDDPVWRFNFKNVSGQRVSFVNADNQSFLFFWITPVFKERSVRDEEKGVIEHFQNKDLKDFKFSPDINLADQNIVRSEKKIGNRLYHVMALVYELEKEPRELDLYYYVSPKRDVLYLAALLKDKKKITSEEDGKKLSQALELLLEKIEYKQNDSFKMAQLRANYAYTDFLDAASDKYLKEKAEKAKEKYDLARQQVLNWIKLDPKSYKAYNLLGVLATYNQKLEHYGDGFDSGSALENFGKAIQIRKYFKIAHMNLAEVYENLGRFQDAIREYEYAAQISPNDENLHYKIGKIYEKMNDRASAKRCFEKAIRHWGSGFGTLEELKSKIRKWESEQKI